MAANSNDAMTLEARWGIRVVERADAGKVAPADEILALLALEPNKGLFELERAIFEPAVTPKTVRSGTIAMSPNTDNQCQALRKRYTL